MKQDGGMVAPRKPGIDQGYHTDNARLLSPNLRHPRKSARHR